MYKIVLTKKERDLLKRALVDVMLQYKENSRDEEILELMGEEWVDKNILSKAKDIKKLVDKIDESEGEKE